MDYLLTFLQLYMPFYSWQWVDAFKFCQHVYNYLSTSSINSNVGHLTICQQFKDYPFFSLVNILASYVYVSTYFPLYSNFFQLILTNS
jgi:hypothetical protein